MRDSASKSQISHQGYPDIEVQRDVPDNLRFKKCEGFWLILEGFKNQVDFRQETQARGIFLLSFQEKKRGKTDCEVGFFIEGT